jgi:hypothetical protein
MRASEDSERYMPAAKGICQMHVRESVAYGSLAW